MKFKAGWVAGLGALVLVCVATALWLGRGSTSPVVVTVYAPCAMEQAFTAAKKAFEREHPATVIDLTVDSVGILVRRITSKGQRPDIIALLGDMEMQWLVDAGRVAPADVRRIGRYDLVLFVPRDNPGKVADFPDLLKPEVKMIALPSPDKNSAGRHAQQALVKMGLWQQIQPKLILRDPPRAAYQLLAQGKVEASLAYRPAPKQRGPGLVEMDKVRMIKSVPMDLYDPASATVAVLSEAVARGPAEEFVAFLLSARGTAILAENGIPTVEATPPAARGE